MVRHLLTLAHLIISAVPCALAFPFLLASLLAILNPGSGFGPLDLLGAWGLLAAAYGLPILLLFPLAVAMVRFFAARPLRLTWIHLKSMVWFLVAGVGLAAALFAWNLERGGDLISGTAASGLAAALAAVTLLWGAGTIVAASAQMKGSGAGAPRFVLALTLLLATIPVSLLGLRHAPASIAAAPGAGGPRSRAGSVTIVAIEGASLSEILPLIDEGRLPALADLMQQGSHGPLATLRPCRSAAAWASLSTGKFPSGHGIRDAALYRMAGVSPELRRLPEGILLRTWLPSGWLGSRSPVADDLLVSPAWEILRRRPARASFISWPLAGGESAGRKPARDEASSWLSRIRDGLPPGHGESAIEELRGALESDGAAAREALGHLVGPAIERPKLVAVRLRGLGVVAREFAGRPPGDPVDKEDDADALLLSRYYEILDGLVGRIRAATRAGDYTIVLSAYGHEPLPRIERVAREAVGMAPSRIGHAEGPAGIFFMAGPGIIAGRQVDDVRVTDIVPLSLYLLGLPVGRDMNGKLPRRLFSRGFLESNPISFVASYG